MVCGECRKAGNLARAVLRAPATGTHVPMGSLHSVMRGHERCKGGTWCDCKHLMPVEGKGRG